MSYECRPAGLVLLVVKDMQIDLPYSTQNTDQVPRVRVSAVVRSFTWNWAIIMLQKTRTVLARIKFNPLLVPNRTRTWFRSA